MKSAKTPPMRKKANDVTMYRMPMSLWFVEANQPSTPGALA